MSDIEKIKKLRQSTGAGFKDCSSAILEANGDIEKAKQLLGWEPQYSLDDMFEHSVLWANNKSKAIKNK